MSLTSWASYREALSPALANISDENFQFYSMKAGNIQGRGLADDMDSIWDSIPEVSRSLIIYMWVTRPESHRDISHPTPTIIEAEQLVDGDWNLTAQEVVVAKDIIHRAVDHQGIHLFRAA
jgi:hypothetical protein